jgi:hypothetical protein
LLLDKLCHYGIRGTAIDWFVSYLHGRKQYVQNGNATSSVLTVKTGVPQGSILGPLLFLVYINDIVTVSDVASLIMFADDTNLFFSGTDLTPLCTSINQELDKISGWFKSNKLSLNVSKTNYILFSSKALSKEYNSLIKINGVKVNRVSSTRFLGVIINETLTWSDHVSAIRQKVSKNVGIIKHIRCKLPSTVLTSLYFTLVHPYFEYCNIVWGVCRSTSFNKLFLLQKKAVRIVTLSPWNCHTGPLFKKLNILPLASLNDFQVGCFMHRCVDKITVLPGYFCNMFCKNAEIHSYESRYRSNVHMIGCRLTLRKLTFRYVGPKLWNSLPIKLRSHESMYLFKKHFKHFLIERL